MRNSNGREDAKMVNRLLLLLLVLFLTACGEKHPVIGVETLNSKDFSKSVVKIHFFESKDAADDYYHEKGSINYVLMVHKEKDEMDVFKQVDGVEEDGQKIVEFKTENDTRADDLAFEYLYGELGLEIDCAFNGKECK